MHDIRLYRTAVINMGNVADVNNGVINGTNG